MLDTVLGGTPTAPVAFPRPEPASVLRVDAGELYVTLDAFPDVEHGPCRWARPAVTVEGAHTHTVNTADTGTTTRTTTSSGAHEHDAGDPPVGTAVLVYFAGPGIADPWVLAFDGWPSSSLTARHLRLPLALGVNGGLVTVAEDSLEELAQSASVVLRTRQGERLATPDLGTPDPVFRGLDAAAALEVVTTWEPRASLELVEQLLDGDGTETTTVRVARREES